VALSRSAPPPPTPSVSGSVIRANRRALGQVVGEDLVRSVFAAEPRYAFWEEATGVEWLELGVVEESLRAVAAKANRDPVAMNVEITRIGAEQTLRTIWRVLLRFTSTQALVARAGILYARAFNTGRIVFEAGAPGEGSLRIVDWASPPRFHMFALAAGIETVLQLTGRADARVRYDPPAQTFRVTATVLPPEGEES
jgi:hypothetical protein